MPQFDLNLLNFQNVLIYVFLVSYLFYIKEINFYFFYLSKLPSQLNLHLFWFFFKKKIYLNQLFKHIFNLLLLDFKQLKLCFLILSLENNYYFFVSEKL